MFIPRVGQEDQQSDERVDNASEKQMKKKNHLCTVTTCSYLVLVKKTNRVMNVLTMRPKSK
jgi:hypothetical protein